METGIHVGKSPESIDAQSLLWLSPSSHGFGDVIGQLIRDPINSESLHHQATYPQVPARWASPEIIQKKFILPGQSYFQKSKPKNYSSFE